MRKVAAYSLTLTSDSVDSGESLVADTRSRIDAWLDAKGKRVDADDRVVIAFSDGRQGEVQRSELRSENGELSRLCLTESSVAGLFATNVTVGRHLNELGVYIELRAGGESTQVQPLQLDVRCPKIVRDVIDGPGDWQVGEIPVTSRPIPFAGHEGGCALVKILWHPSRNLPVVTVSEFEGRYIDDEFPAKLARDLSGLAVVATLDPDAAWAITYERGKEWSCYNGALRVYWPMQVSSEEPLKHPLWTQQRLLVGVSDSRQAANRIRQQLRRRVLGLSAFSVGEPRFFREVRREAREAEVQRLRDSAAEDSEWRSLAESYSEDNNRLQTLVDEQEKQLEDLQTQIRNLQTALQWQTEDQDIAPESTLPPNTVADAVSQARAQFDHILVFGRDVDGAVKELDTDAGPPEKVFRHLKILAELGRSLNQGSIGETQIEWLRSRGVDASGESDTRRKAGGRTWWVEDERLVFDRHTKPSDATSLGRCVRIYFHYDSNRRKMLIGWVGRHP